MRCSKKQREQNDRRRELRLMGDRWWIEMEHPTFGTAKVTMRWEPANRSGVYSAIVESVEFDLFTPAAEQEPLMAAIRQTNIRALAPVSA